jgi:exopolysaccharide biosynthesis polyprenyl glycosylphosphotransferase
MSIGGIYIGPRTVITFSAELLWLGMSTILLITVNRVSLGDSLTLTAILLQALVLVALYLAIFYVMDLYDSALLTPTRGLLLNLVQAAGILLVIIGIVAAGTHVLRLNPRVVFVHTALTIAFVLIARLAIEHSADPAIRASLIGVVASDPLRYQLSEENAQRTDLGLDFLWIGDSLEKARAALAAIKKPQSYLRKILIDRELIGSHSAVQFLELCRDREVQIEELRLFIERVYGKVSLGPDAICDFATSPMISSSKAMRAVRRVRDVALASLGLIVTLPITLIAIVAIKCDSSGPAIYRQERVGENGRLFTMFKFRSMRMEKLRPDVVSLWSTAHADPRVTRVGEVLRGLHLDELPQLINVIRGEMSLVGPRPFHPLHVAELESTVPQFGLRHLVKPGITGWAQIRCDYAASFENRGEVFARDLYYVKHASFLFDLQILLETVRVCLWRRGSR